MIIEGQHSVSDNTIPLSVITVVKNGEKVIEDCIRSVLEQGISNIEYIVVDGASTDRTLEIVMSFGDLVTSVVSEPDLGLYDAMNKGLALAHGQFVHFLNADDQYASPETLALLLPKLDFGSVCHAQITYREGNGYQRVLGNAFSRERELKMSSMPQPAMFVPLEFYEDTGGFDLSYQVASDYDMVLRLTEKFPTQFIEQITTKMNAGGISDQKALNGFFESMMISRRYGRTVAGSRLDYSLKCAKFTLNRLPGVSSLRALSRLLLK